MKIWEISWLGTGWTIKLLLVSFQIMLALTKSFSQGFCWDNPFLYTLIARNVQMRRSFWSLFSCIRTEYEDLLSKYPYSEITLYLEFFHAMPQDVSIRRKVAYKSSVSSNYVELNKFPKHTKSRKAWPPIYLIYEITRKTPMKWT